RRRGRSQGRWSLRTGNDSPFPVSGLLDLIECAGDPSGSARPRTGRAGRSIPGEPGEKERKDEDTPQAKARGSAHRALPRIGDGHTVRSRSGGIRLRWGPTGPRGAAGGEGQLWRGEDDGSAHRQGGPGQSAHPTDEEPWPADEGPT